jgi:hypothetical protein
MRRLMTICLFALAAALVAAPASLAASAPAPTITRVKPMRVSVGNLLTITGTRFKAQRLRNTVIFRGPDGRTAFAKPRRATTRKLVVRVPAAVARLLRVSGSRQRPTRLKLRVLSGKFSKFTPRRLSPVVTGVGDGDGGPGGGPGGDGGGTVVVCNNSADHDGDLLPNTLELTIGTDPCLEDTDQDQMTDGWEYWSAKDLNIKAVPYPGKRPFPNALDPGDGAPVGSGASSFDFDGDGLTTLEEFRAWRYTGRSFDPARATIGLESVLGYSDGTKFSRASDVPGVPAWQSANFGMANPPYAYPDMYDIDEDPGVYRDDERDADGDGVGNFIESARGPGKYTWWQGFWKQDAIQVEAWKKESYCGQRPGDYDQRPFADLDLADPDVDGDTLLDGEDDQDNDDFINVLELYEVFKDLDGNGGPPGSPNPAWCGRPLDAVPSITFGGVDSALNAFNPCAPNMESRSCPERVPFDD